MSATICSLDLPLVVRTERGGTRGDRKRYLEVHRLDLTRFR